MFKLAQYFNRLEYINWLIKTESTGTPKELSAKLNMSERRIFDYINFMKTELNVPIKYCYNRKSYVYKTKEGELNLKWKKLI